VSHVLIVVLHLGDKKNSRQENNFPSRGRVFVLGADATHPRAGRAFVCLRGKVDDQEKQENYERNTKKEKTGSICSETLKGGPTTAPAGGGTRAGNSRRATLRVVAQLLEPSASRVVTRLLYGRSVLSIFGASVSHSVGASQRVSSGFTPAQREMKFQRKCEPNRRHKMLPNYDEYFEHAASAQD
jgi:hypothetical protein